MKLSNEQLIDKLKDLGLVNIETNKPISYSGFKNRSTIFKYGKKYKTVFVGQPKQNLFGFYTMWGNDTEVMKEAYDMFVSLVKGDMSYYNDKDIQWGNAGMPLEYGNLKTI